MASSETFSDHFSGVASAYARYRPGYPDELFRYLSSLVGAGASVWDCATGSGQCANRMANYFENITATDASYQQLAGAASHPRISFVQSRAESSALAGNSQDLITVAQALHWFDLDSFYSEVRRVARSQAVIAVWSYNLLHIDPPIDEVIAHLYHKTLAGLWPPERDHVETGYTALPFPFQTLPSGDYRMRARWSLEQLLGYIGTWSAVTRDNRRHPSGLLRDLAQELARLWPQGQRMSIEWPLTVKIGRID